MNPDDLQKLVRENKWELLGRGGCNSVGLSKKELTIGNHTGLWVYKRPSKPHPLSNPERAVRKWNTLNPELPAWQTTEGWLAPYLGSVQANDRQIAQKLVKTYQETRIIILDAFVSGNVLVYENEPVYVDVDYAVSKGSTVSNSVNRDLQDFRQCFARAQSRGFTLSVTIIQNLVYLEKELSEEAIDNRFISFRTIFSLSYFRRANARLTSETMALLAKIEVLDESNELDCQFFAPEFINQLETIQAVNPIESKAQLFELIAGILIRRSTLAELIKEKNLEGIQFLNSQNPALLTQKDNNGFNLLHLAAFYNSLEIAQYLIQQGLPIDEASPAESTRPNKRPIDFAISERSFGIVQLLLEKGVIISPESTNHPNYLLYAAWSGHLELVQSLIQTNPDWLHFRDDLGQNALLWAASRGQTPVVDFLLLRGVNPNYSTQSLLNRRQHDNTALDWAIINNHRETMKRLEQAKAKAHRTHQKIGNQGAGDLIAGNDLEGLTFLLGMNTELLNHASDSWGFLPLHYAVYYGRLDMVKYLVGAKAETSIRVDGNGENETWRDMIPLEMAIIKDNFEIASFLLQRTTQVLFIRDRGRAMFFAAKHGLLPLMEILVNNNFKLLYLRNTNNQTPLSIAARHEQLEVVRYLIKMGADLNPITIKARGFFHSKCPEKDATPLDLAILEKHWAVVDVLVAAGARANIYSVNDHSKDGQAESLGACSSSQG